MTSKKIRLDKYYTSEEIAEHCFKKTLKIIGEENITEFIESSAGNGVFLDMMEKYTPNISYKAYDIEPDDDRIIQQDYLELDMEYKEGRVCGFNFPFGNRNVLLWKFYRKSITHSEYIASILPISQFNNDQQLYEFDLIYSEDLGKQLYSGKLIHCSFNIYKKPINGINIKKNNYKLKDVTIKENRQARNQYIPSTYKYDIGICVWGDVGKELEYERQYNQEAYIKINNEDIKEECITLIRNANWREIYPMSTSPTLKQWQIYKYLKEQIPQLE